MTIFLASVLFVVFWDMNNLWHPYLNFKPFNCVPCFSVWVAIILFLLPEEISRYISIAFGAGVVAPLLKYLFTKI